MADRNEAVVREACEAGGRGDVARMLEFIDREPEWTCLAGARQKLQHMRMLRLNSSVPLGSPESGPSALLVFRAIGEATRLGRSGPPGQSPAEKTA